MEHDYDGLTEQQLKKIERYVTNTKSHIFALRNLPEVIKGAVFSRYSRYTLGLRTLLLKEFILNEETEFTSITGEKEGIDQEGQSTAIKKAQNFYDRILDGYGDDSIGELGGAHLALENISMIAAKVIEDCRIGGSPLEKSTRYIYFDQKVQGKYLFYREPILMTSAYRNLYENTCDMLFEVYGRLIPTLTESMEKVFPKEHETSAVAYTAAIRAKVLDCLRGLLPASALTNMGVYGNGRFFEILLQKLNCQSLEELQHIGRLSYQELSKVIPSFIRRADLEHKHQKSFCEFKNMMEEVLSSLARDYTPSPSSTKESSVQLIHYDPDNLIKVAGALLFSHSKASLQQLLEIAQKLPKEEVSRILEAGASFRQSRRHKSPRALEQATFTFEIISDFGIYRDLQRHRMLTQERQLLSCDLGYFIPREILGTSMEKEYREAMEKGKIAYDQIVQELPEEAQYVVPMAYNIRWYFHLNLRALQWICELRSSAAGHPTYRFIAQEMAKQVIQIFPEFERFFRFIDYDGYELGRLGQEEQIIQKSKKEKE